MLERESDDPHTEHETQGETNKVGLGLATRRETSVTGEGVGLEPWRY